MRSAVDLQSAVASVASLRRQAEALAELQRRCAQLRDARERSHAQIDAVAAAVDERIDECIDECIRIRKLVPVGAPTDEWKNAVIELERQFRRLGVLRSQVLALYVTPVDARCGS